MALVKWIKITTDIFDDEKMLIIDGLPDRDGIIVIWFKLLCLAGKQNNGGVFIMNDKIAYTDEMLAAIFRRPLNTVRLALNTFQQFGMIEIIDDVITIPNWSKHQTLDAYEKRKERDRLYQQERRKQQKALAASVSTDTSSDASTDGSVDVAPLEEEREREREIEIEEATEKDHPDRRCTIPYETIRIMYNTYCPSFPECRSLSDARKKAIKARFNTYTVEDFETLFKKAETSDFLRGKNSRSWSANFDWLIKDANMAKVLDGNYDNKGGHTTGTNDYGNPEDFYNE